MNYSILIVDGDSALFTERLKQCQQNLQLSVAVNGAEAIKTLTEGLRPHLIMVDTHSPTMDGYELLVWIMKSPIYRRVPIVVWAGEMSDDEVIRYYKAGANAVMLKPDTLHSMESFCKYWFETVQLPQLTAIP